MRGQANVVTSVLLAAIAISLAVGYYAMSTGMFSRSVQQSQAEIEAKILTEKYLRISDARIFPYGLGSKFVVYLYNAGDEAIPLLADSQLSWYIYDKSGILLDSGVADPRVDLNCTDTTYTDRIMPGDVCMFTKYTDINGDLSNKYIVIYLNDNSLTADFTVVPGIGPTHYVVCDGCADCTAILAGAAPDTLVYVRPTSATGDCISISNKSNIYIYCLGPIQGDGSGVGLSISNSSNIYVYGCDFSNFSTGISLSGSTDLSFDSVYSHDNVLYDLYLDVSTADTSFCRQSKVGITTTAGPVVYLRGVSSYSATDTPSAIWIYSSNIVTFDGSGNTASKVSPAILVCDSNAVTVTDFSASSVAVGAALLNDSGTHLEGITLSNVVDGVLSIGSVNNYMSDFVVSFSNTAQFVNTDNFRWDLNVVFTG